MLRPRLEGAIGTLRAGNALLPVKVVVPNHLLGVWLSRSIFKDTGHMAIEFVLAHELAWKVAAPSLLREGRARVPENVGLAVLLGAIPEAVAHAGTPEYLREAVKTAGFAPAALRTIEDLAGANLRPDRRLRCWAGLRAPSSYLTDDVRGRSSAGSRDAASQMTRRRH